MRFLIWICLAALPVYSATYDAATCSLANVQSAYASEQASKADGDIINIPSCTSTTWASSWSISPTNSLTFQGQTTVVGTCMPGGSCTPTDNTIIALGNAVQFQVNIASGKTFRFTGMTMNPGGSTAEYGSLTFNGNNDLTSTLRLDHCHINDTVGGDHTIQPDALKGVIDHNYFDSTNQSNLFFIQPTINGADGESNATWTVAENFGTNQFLFVENNFFQNGAFLFDCDFGGRLVFRYNTGWYNTRIQTHGVGSGAQRRGCRTMEVYNNTFTYSNSPNSSSFAFLVDYESGTAMWWGNTITAFTTFLREDVVRTNSDTYEQTANPGGWGYCGANLGPSNWDGNNDSTGQPCLDGIGRGAGDLLTGSLPNLVNQITGTIAWPHQARIPVYAWLNTLNTNSYAPNHYWQNYDTASTENRDYYIQLPNVNEASSFNGSAGTGSGLLSARPSTCTAGPGGNTPGVGYWATDTQTFYVCNPTNTWTPYYTPYTYPHPLTQGSSGCTISPASIGPYSGGQSVSQPFTASNCNSSTFTISSGSLAGSGLSLDSSTGVLSGTGVNGSFSFTVSYGGASQPISLTIMPVPPTKIVATVN